MEPNEMPKINPPFVYITCPYMVSHHGFVMGEQARTVFQKIDKADMNGYEIWVYSKAARNARPVSLIPGQYSLTPLKATDGQGIQE